MTILMRRWRWLPTTAALALSTGLEAIAIDGSKVVDLSYSFGPDTIYWRLRWADAHHRAAAVSGFFL